jgi:hypothetical protein
MFLRQKLIILALLVVAALGADQGAIKTNPVDRKVEVSPEDVRSFNQGILKGKVTLYC